MSYYLTCKACGKSFSCQQPNAKTCSDKCRKQWQRTRGKFEQDYLIALGAIARIKQVMKKHEELRGMGKRNISKLKEELEV